MQSSKDISTVCSTFAPPTTANGNGTAVPPTGRIGLTKINTESAALGTGASSSTSPNSTVRSSKTPLSPVVPKDDSRRKSIPMIAAVQAAPPSKPEDPNSPEAKKKAALATGPVLKVDSGNSASYGMHDSLFSALKDLFEAIITHHSRTGVISPQKFVEILKRDNEMFRSSLHQDAHEFLNYVLNQVIESVELYQRKLSITAKPNGITAQPSQLLSAKNAGSLTPIPDSSAASTTSETTSSATMVSSISTVWIHDLFEGLLTSETKCLTCETISRRDEVFLDLSIDLDKHASVTSCLRNFSASEMLCERNKFHCDCCGGLQEAEKRMKIKRLPRILALHLKRFKYSEDLGRHQKLFHRVVYPYYLRLFNTTDDAEDQDRLYELYAVVVHIGGGPYHGHYVTIVKTEDKGWLLFDDELVEPVDKSYVRNFFGGDEKKLACAYVLFYQESTFEKMQKDLQEEMQPVKHAPAPGPMGETSVDKEEKSAMNGGPIHYDALDAEDEKSFAHAATTPSPVAISDTASPSVKTPAAVAAEHAHVTAPLKSKKGREKERKEEKAAAKHAAKLASDEVAAVSGDTGREGKEKEGGKGFNRFRTTSKSLARGHSWFGGAGGGVNGKERKEERKSYENGALHNHPDDNAPILVHGNGNDAVVEAGKAKSEEAKDAAAEATVEKEETKEEHIPPPSQPQPLTPHTPQQQQQQQQQSQSISSSSGRPAKEKKKGLWSGLRRKTSIMMSDS